MGQPLSGRSGGRRRGLDHDAGGLRIGFDDRAGQDVTSEVGGEKAMADEVTIGADSGVLGAVGSGSMTIGFTFIAAGRTDTSTRPNPLDLARRATAKVLAAGLG